MSEYIPKTAADFETILSLDTQVGATSFTLSSAADVDGNNLASGIYGFTLDGDTEYKEFCIGALSGTAVTSVFHISAQGVPTSGLNTYHRRGAEVAITDWVVLGRLGAVNRGEVGFDSAAPLFYDGNPTFASDPQIVTKKYVDDLVNGGTVSYNQVVLTSQIAGENLTANDHVYFKESDQRWWKVDVDDSATYTQVRRGIALSTQTTAGTLSIAIAGLVTGFVGLTAGAKYYGGSTAGAIVTGGTNAFVGVAFSTTVLIIDPYIRDIPSGDEKDALAGSLGTPSSDNLYLTELNQTQGGVQAEQTTQDQTTGFGLADTTGLNNILAQSFTATKTKIRGLSLYKTTDTGSFTGTVTVSLQADTAGSPSGSSLASVVLTNAEWLALLNGRFSVLFSSEYSSMTVGSLYWIVATSSTSDSSNHPNIRSNSAGGYADGSVKYFNTTDGWTAIATIDLYFQALEGNTSQVVETKADGYIGASLIPQLLATNTTSVNLTASNTETTIFSKTVKGGLLNTNNVLRGKIYFSNVAKASGDSLTLRLKYGAGTLATILVQNTAANVISTVGVLTFDIIANNLTNAQVAFMQFITSIGDGEQAADTVIGVSKLMGSSGGTGTQDSTGALTLSVTAQYSSTSGTDNLTANYGYIELIRQ